MSSSPTAARQRAAAAVELMLVDRETAADEANAALALGPDDGVTAAMAHRVLSSVATHRGQMAAAEDHADRAVAAGERASDDELVGWALLTRMGVLLSTGRVEQAITDSYRAESLLPPSGQVRLLIQRGTALGLGLGRVDEAIATYDRVEAEHDVLEPIVEAVLTMNRGTQLTARGDHQRALADFATARARYRELGNVEAECDVLLHEARAAARIGDFPTVFALHAEVEERNLFAERDHRTANDLAEALLLSGLTREAADLSSQALALVDHHLSTTAAAEAALRLASLRADVGDDRRAAELCDLVSAWAAERMVDGVGLSAELVRLELRSAASVDVGTVAMLADLARRLDVDGRSDEAEDVRVRAAMTARSLHRPDLVIGSLDGVERAGPGNLPAPVVARRRHADALRFLAAGDHGRAVRQLSAGLDSLERMRSTIGALDLRAAAADRAPDLAQLGVELAAATKRPRRLLRWAEQQRAVALRLTTPPDGQPPLRRDEGTRRAHHHELDMVRRARQRRQRPSALSRVSADDIVDAVDGRILLEFVEVGGRLDVLVIHRGRVRHLVDLLSVDALAGNVDRIQFGLRRMTERSEARRVAAAQLVDGVASALDRQLLAGLPDADSDIIIVPSGRLHLLPWRVMPSLRHRGFTVSPSAHLWVDADERRLPHQRVAAVAGPDLPHAEQEISAIVAAHGSSAYRVAPTVGASLEALATAGTLHLAAHGEFRNDNALFSSLRLDDGPLFVYDLDQVGTLPSRIVLSACNVGSVSVLRGDEVLGFPAALLARRARTVVAALLPVEDEAAHDLMVAFHRHLAAGRSAAGSLAAAAASIRDRSPHHRVAAESFVAFGAA